MPAAVAIPAIATVAGSVGGAAIGALGNRSASKTQEKAAQQALAWEKSQYADEQARLQPYRDMGGQAFAMIGQKLGMPAYQGGPAQPQGKSIGAMRAGLTEIRDAGGPQKFMGAGQTIGQMRGAQPQAPQMVMVQAPTGETRQLPAHLAQQAVQKGARIVNGGGAQGSNPMEQAV